MQEKYSMHVIELVRNNGISTMPDDVDHGFLMFDYFDILIHKELNGKDKQYVNYFSIGDTFDDDQAYKVSYKTLSLYCDSERDRDPFVLYGSKEDDESGENLSGTPFLGIIQISLCKENYVRADRDPVDVDAFLTKCEKKILNMVEDVCVLKEYDPMVMQLYRSSTTGDFCLVIRTDSVEKIYNVALSLSDSQSNRQKALKVRTYTNVGIECRYCPTSDGEGRYATLEEAFVSRHENMSFALRFSADSDLLYIWRQYQQQGGKVEFEPTRGLFGRYDYLLHINLRQFAEIYPVLCEKKFGIPDGYHVKMYQEDVFTLKNILRHPHIKNINERILVNLDIIGAMKASTDDIDEAYLKVKEGNERLFKRINALSKWRCYFAEEDRAFRDLHRGMIGIYKTYSAIGMEKDAYINWLMFYRDMDVLCGCLEVCLQEYERMNRDNIQGGSKRRVHRLRLLKDWRINIQALNQYTRLVQNINYQTYQSPIYEIQTQIDTEKTMIAYRQAMISYMESYIEFEEMENEDVIPSIPIIYPDLAKDRVEVIAPFSNQKERKDQLVWREIMCTVPSFEYFGRLYDLLPWMIHESSHHLRILGREKRNFFFARYVFSYIYRVIIENELPILADDRLYKTVGKVEWHLIDCMVNITLEDLKVRVDPDSGRLFENFGFEQVIDEIETYLNILFGDNGSFEGKEAWYDIKDIRESVYHFLLSEYRKEGLLNEQTFDRIAQFKRAEMTGEGDELIEPLLVCYYQQVDPMEEDSLEEGGLKVKDIKCPQEWFERNILKMSRKLENAGVGRDAVKEYHFKVTRLYRILNACVALSRGGGQESDNIREYLERVYKHYRKQEEKNGWREKEALLMNPRTMHVLRSLGLLNWEEELFCSKMREIFRKNDHGEMIKHMELKTKVYREAFADLLMVTALDINSFGYCRQVLQTISDARMEENAYGEDDINNQRFQIVVGVLLEEELCGGREPNQTEILRDEEIGRIKLDGHSIIDKGVSYCEYTLKCITGKLQEMPEVANDQKKLEEVTYFIGAVFEQLKCFLQDVECGDVYNSTLLYVLLHGKEKADPEIVELWDQCHYDEIERLCPPIKYIFWRLEYFCLGLKYIMPNGCVIIPLDIFEHMKAIRRGTISEDRKGCKWEKDWECLMKTKMDVGEFYNEPRLVFEKQSSQKLENTIEFIQNFYYYNRFRMMEEESNYDTGEQEG